MWRECHAVYLAQKLGMAFDQGMLALHVIDIVRVLHLLPCRCIHMAAHSDLTCPLHIWSFALPLSRLPARSRY